VDSETIARMRAEEADLMRKLKAVRDFLAVYGDDAPRVALPADNKRAAGREKVSITGFSRYGQIVVAECMRLMLTASHPTKTRALVEFLEATGIEISGENKINAVGALLSRSADIISHGKAGWTLADPTIATQIVAEHGHKENEPEGKDASGSDAGQGNAPTFSKPWVQRLSTVPG
jgi:hypothetical protein